MTRLRMEEVEAAARQFEAAGNNTRVMPGRWFRLVDRSGKYPFAESMPSDAPTVPHAIRCAGNEFLIVSVHHVATNNYLQKDSASHYRNVLTCIRKGIQWRPGRGLNSVDTRIHAPQTARVVGPGVDGTIHTDQYGRIRLQFHWDRVGKYDAGSSAWIRVATNWAGSEFGATSVPRVG
jgi:type VI secretion system secreted protein VgrG